MSDARSFPILGLLSSGTATWAYVAWNDRDLETCPLHELLRSRRARHRLVAADGSTHEVVAEKLAGMDWARAREVGWVTQAVSALLSGLNPPVRIRLELAPLPSASVDSIREELAAAVAAKPAMYGAGRSKTRVLAALRRAKSVRELALAVSNIPAPPQDAEDGAEHGG